MDPAAAAVAPALAGAAAAIDPPSYDIDFDTATAVIGTLPSLHPRPSHANIRALERDLFEKLETLQSSQSEEWGFRGLAEQPAEYALKSTIPWVHAPNPGQHRTLGLNAADTRDAEAVFEAQKIAYQAQATVTRAVIAALNTAVPKAFRRATNAAGHAIVGSAAYRSNQDPRAILLHLWTTYGIPSPAERNANEALFAAPWNTSEPIEAYFDRIEDCFVAAMIASPPYTTEQMIIRAITSIQLTGLYSQALIEWNALPDADKTWDRLKQHFTAAYIAREQSGTGTTGANGYHMAANVVATDDALSNIENTFTTELTTLQLANNAQHQTTLASIADLRAALTTAQQQLALLTVTPPTPAPTYIPTPPPYALPPYAPAPPPPAYAPTTPYHALPNTNQRRRGNGRYRRPNYAVPGTIPPPVTPSHPPNAPVVAPSPGPSHIPPYSAALPAVPPATPGGPRPNPPNPKKYYNNWNYCYSCGYDIPSWHTSQTCNNPKPHHQQGCTRANVAAYKAAGHLVSERNAHKTILPINPGQHQA